MDNITEILTTIFVSKPNKKKVKSIKIYTESAWSDSSYDSSSPDSSSESSSSDSSSDNSSSESEEIIKLNTMILFDNDFKEVFKLLLEKISQLKDNNNDFYPIASVITSVFSHNFKLLKIKMTQKVFHDFKIFNYNEIDMINFNIQNKTLIVIIYINNATELNSVKKLIQKYSEKTQFILMLTDKVIFSELNEIL